MSQQSGFSMGDLGDAKKAITYYERALAIDEKIYGKDHPNVANISTIWVQHGMI